jgi:hypothetical protein
MSTVDHASILARLDLIESGLRRLTLTLAAASEPVGGEHRQTDAEDRSDWVDSTAFCRLAGIKNQNSLSYFMSKGIFTNKSIRNIGTAKRPRYRFHRRMAVDEFLNRSKLHLP